MADESTTNASADSSTELALWKGTARYEVLSCLGQGGMGIVYEVFDQQRSERVALKKLLHFDAGNLYRFKQEFRTLADGGAALSCSRSSLADTTPLGWAKGWGRAPRSRSSMSWANA